MTLSNPTHLPVREADESADPRIDEGEAIEVAALQSLHDIATPLLRDRLGLCWATRDTARLSIAARLPSAAIVVNRAFGVRAVNVGRIAADYTAAGARRFFLHADKEAGDLSEASAAAVLRPARPWQKFVRRRGATLPTVANIAICQVLPDMPEAAATVARLTCAAFDLGEDAEPWLARLCHDRRWHVFLATVGNRPAGAGALFVSKDGIGWSDWGATCPTMRGQGVQRALLVHRLRLADALGLDRVHSCTGAPIPGDPQHSYRNLMRCGFVPTYLRENWQPAE